MTDDLRTTITDRFNTYLANNPVLAQKELPPDIQENLIKSLLDGSVYSVVSSLTHLQELKESDLLNLRYRRVRELGADSEDVTKVQAIDRNITEQIDEVSVCEFYSLYFVFRWSKNNSQIYAVLVCLFSKSQKSATKSRHKLKSLNSFRVCQTCLEAARLSFDAHDCLCYGY
jgi:hypothetical protein